MFLTRKRAFARAGLLGNPSDGYHGKTISFSVRNYWAEVVLYEWDSVEIVLAGDDRAKFDSVHELARDVRLHGYYGGIRLIKATDQAVRRALPKRAAMALHDRKFSVRYRDDDSAAGRPGRLERDHRRHAALPDGVLRRAAAARGAADVRAARRAGRARASRSVLQDRVIQVYEGLVYMDFDRSREHIVDGLTCYRYEPMDPALLPPLYVAHHETLGEPTEIFHNNIRERFRSGDGAGRRAPCGASRELAADGARGAAGARRRASGAL